MSSIVSVHFNAGREFCIHSQVWQFLFSKDDTQHTPCLQDTRGEGTFTAFQNTGVFFFFAAGEDACMLMATHTVHKHTFRLEVRSLFAGNTTG